jgi:hypothetical protein
MLYESPADFCARYPREGKNPSTTRSDEASEPVSVTLVSETPDTARVEVVWYTYGHDYDSGFYDVHELTAINLVRSGDRWIQHSEEPLGSV